MKKIIITSIIILTFIFTYFFHVPEIAASDSQDKTEISEFISGAETAIAEAYVAVLAAEEAGADTDELQDNLNIAGDYLSQCRIAFRMGEYADALLSAELCSQIASLISVEAMKAIELARSKRHRTLLITAAYTTVYMLGVSLGSLYLWRTWKRRYIDRIQKMEIRSVNESE